MSAWRRPPPTTALVIPDEQTWTLHDRDPADLGLEVTYSVARARRLLVADDLPPELTAPLAQLAAVSASRNGGHVHDDDAAVVDDPSQHAAHGHGHERDPRADDAHGHDHSALQSDEGHAMTDHDGHDMMAIVGEPSADGLVMEPLELRYGPLATPLPGGLAAEVTLDGDVVAEARIEALLRAAPPGGGGSASPDALAPAAWAEAITRAVEATETSGAPTAARWPRVGAVEVERAVSHLAWLRAFMRLLGWAEAVKAVTGALHPLTAARRGLSAGTGRHDLGAIEAGSELEAARAAIAALAGRLRSSRALRLRTHGRGTIAADDAVARDLSGPAARACGIADDARTEDPLYRLLGFEPLLRDEGDAHARTLLRVEEAEQSTQLALAALDRVASDDAHGARVGSLPATVEGPRGPLRARRRGGTWELEARGAQSARSLAGELMVGAEWAAALVVLASLDLSPWVVSP